MMSSASGSITIAEFQSTTVRSSRPNEIRRDIASLTSSSESSRVSARSVCASVCRWSATISETEIGGSKASIW